jgi:hypothetical protein
MFSCNIGASETPNHLPEKTFLNDASMNVSSYNFGPCGGYPSKPLEWLYELAKLCQYIGPWMCQKDK